jgi:2-polyprenyl-3-methyl-5-hydroxy-6-metoxy-1,4-benzoquinol methylase
VPDQSYLLDNSWLEARARLDAVEAFLDPGTIRCLADLGDFAGRRCVEIGAGGGSIAKWLAERVGPDGLVVATDIDITHLGALGQIANIEIRQHDIVKEPFEADAYDLVHARLVLEHIPERNMVFRKLARALRPNGWLVIESVEYVSAVSVSEFGAIEHERSQDIRLREFEAAGLAMNYGRHLPATMRAEGLIDIGNEGRASIMEGGSSGALWFQLSMKQLRGRLVGTGKLTDGDINRMLEIFADPRWSAISPIIFACWGRRAPS